MDFLQSAVDSLLSEGPLSPSVQVIVVKNFDEPDLDAWLRAHDVEIARTEEMALAAMFAVGIKQARGDVIALLDDDDRFSSSKLSILMAEFGADPSLSFYHNAFRYVDAEGVPLDPKLTASAALRRPAPAGKVRIAGPSKGESLRQLAYRHPDFNDSSIAISRELAQKALPYLQRIHFGVDTLFFYLALVEPGTLLIDGRVLTDYRLHGSNRSMSLGDDLSATNERKRRFGERMRTDYSVILELAHLSDDSEVRANAEALILMQRIYGRLRDPRSHRWEMLRDVLLLPRYRHTYVVSSNLLVAVGSLLYPLLPETTRRIYRRKSTTSLP